MEIKNNSKKVGIWIGTIAVLLVGVISVLASRKSAVTPTQVVDVTPVTTPTPTPVTSPVSTPVDIKKQTSVYKDGSYSATGSYMSPGGLDKLGVNLVLKNDIVTSVSVTPLAGDNTSARYQGKFLSAYQPLVIGKNIADLNLTKVSGASLTPVGFNDAIDQIKAQAKA